MRHMCVRSHSSASGEGLLVYLLKAVSAERTKCTVPAVSARAPGAKAPASARMLASTAARAVLLLLLGIEVAPWRLGGLLETPGFASPAHAGFAFRREPGRRARPSATVSAQWRPTERSPLVEWTNVGPPSAVDGVCRRSSERAGTLAYPWWTCASPTSSRPGAGPRSCAKPSQ